MPYYLRGRRNSTVTTTKETGAFLAMGNFFELAKAEAEQVLKEMDRPIEWGHACLIETSVSQVFGAKVRKDRVTGHIPHPVAKELRCLFPKAPAGISFPRLEREEIMNCIWPEGSPGPKGDPDGYSPQIGERIINAVIEPLIKLVDDIKTLEVSIKIV